MELDEKSFDILLNVEKNKLKCKIKLKEKIDDNVDYAFYLLLNNKRIGTKYYTVSDSTEFNLSCDGKYKVVGFVRCKEAKGIKTSNEIDFIFDKNYIIENCETEKNPVPVSIFGSCVSRDILEFDDEKKLSLETYVARQSIVSALANPIDVKYDDFLIKSKFKKNAVYNDFIKNTFNLFINDNSKYLIVDFIDERFKLAKYKGSVVTLSNELKEADIFNRNESDYKINAVSKIKNWKIFKLKNKLFGFSYIYDGILLEEYLKKFCDKILEIYNGENIILHRAVMLDNYKDKNGKIKKFPRNYTVNNKKVNDKLNYMYDFLRENINGIKILDFCKDFYADENHKWGLAPMHYEEDYYRKMISEIIKLIQSR
ncbi:MAG: DUF6270 domain-containing protein [Clostridia bacterium]|jgi:hypothetical protein|nr:DUF6270 domain-containing protein [Clostridia bacterium]MCI2000575.1 DUF6270 domain-containing protein [Clostridia bacterium]MCI2015031.1 DUF6270 domain-containing protein [Clostridia bacterium]